MYEIFFLSYDEDIADENFSKLKKRYPLAKRIHGVKGLLEAHKACAEVSKTSMFWVIDAETTILNGFELNDIQVDDWDKKYIHLWYSRNTVNNLEYGYGGIKLIPTELMLEKESFEIDLTTSFELKIHSEVANINHFNFSPWSAWKSAFREVTKLCLNSDEESNIRLSEWKNTKVWKKNGDFVIKGVNDAIAFATSKENIQLVNDFDWLKNKFELMYGRKTENSYS